MALVVVATSTTTAAAIAEVGKERWSPADAGSVTGTVARGTYRADLFFDARSSDDDLAFVYLLQA